MRRNDSAQRESHSVTQLRTGRATRLGSRGVAGGAGCASYAPRRTELSGARKVSEREQTGKPAVFDHERAPNSGLSELLKGLCCRLVLGHGRDLIAGKHAVAHAAEPLARDHLLRLRLSSHIQEPADNGEPEAAGGNTENERGDPGADHQDSEAAPDRRPDLRRPDEIPTPGPESGVEY